MKKLNVFRPLIFSVILASCVPVFAQQDGRDGGGGDKWASAFTKTGWSVFENLVKTYPSEMPPIDLKKFRTALGADVVSADANDPRLFIFVNGKREWRNAVNYANENLIVINREDWASEPNLVLHEYLGLMDKTHKLDKNYRISSHLGPIKFEEHLCETIPTLDKTFLATLSSNSDEWGGTVIIGDPKEGLSIEYGDGTSARFIRIKKNGEVAVKDFPNHHGDLRRIFDCNNDYIGTITTDHPSFGIYKYQIFDRLNIPVASMTFDRHEIGPVDLKNSGGQIVMSVFPQFPDYSTRLNKLSLFLNQGIAGFWGTSNEINSDFSETVDQRLLLILIGGVITPDGIH